VSTIKVGFSSDAVVMEQFGGGFVMWVKRILAVTFSIDFFNSQEISRELKMFLFYHEMGHAALHGPRMKLMDNLGKESMEGKSSFVRNFKIGFYKAKMMEQMEYEADDYAASCIGSYKETYTIFRELVDNSLKNQQHNWMSKSMLKNRLKKLKKKADKE
jgi:hypothetical protein